MKLTTRSRYGLRAMTYIAEHGEGQAMSLKQIAEGLNLSEPYLEQLLRLLKADGMLESVRGAQGGYYLARDAEQITVGQMLRALEGSLSLSDCVDTDGCDDGGCPTRSVIAKISQSVKDTVDRMTLADMIDQPSRKNQEDLVNDASERIV